jgi:hypothetical protein
MRHLVVTALVGALLVANAPSFAQAPAEKSAAQAAAEYAEYEAREAKAKADKAEHEARERKAKADKATAPGRK